MRLQSSSGTRTSCIGALISAAIAIFIVFFWYRSLADSFYDDGRLRISLSVELVMFLVIFLILIAVGGRFAYRGLRPLVASIRINDPELTISSEFLRVGEMFTLSYRQRFKRPTDVQQVVVSLILRETARYTQGTDIKTVTYDQCYDEKRYPGRHFGTGQSFNQEISLQIPADSMHSFMASNNQLQWYVVAEVVVAGWPNYEEEFEVIVFPER